MFTGIVQKLGKVEGAAGGAADRSMLALETGYGDLALGESVAINGVCLTVAEIAETRALFRVSPETLSRTGLGELAAGDRVNLERALALGERLSGHWVQGHVDGIGKIRAVRAEKDFHTLEVEIPSPLAKYCVEKGSIALDGISLTINSVSENILSFTIIPHTWKETRLHALSSGASVNLEVDILAKYVEKLYVARN